MSAIKFRAWDVINKVMIYSDEPNGNNAWKGVGTNPVQVINEELNNSQYIWLQYTGCMDINATDVYVDDIVRIFVPTDPEMPEYVSRVIYLDGAFVVECKGMDIYTDYFVLGWLEDYEFEVIGTIHENPERLK